MSEVTADIASDLEAVQEWTVLKRDEKADVAFVGAVWVEVGRVEARSLYWLTDDDARALGELGGLGEYLLVHEDRAKRVRVEADFRIADEAEQHSVKA